MLLLGTFISRRSIRTRRAATIIDDIDFFAFPAVNDEHGQDAVEAADRRVHDGGQPDNEEGAKALLPASARRLRSTPTSP